MFWQELCSSVKSLEIKPFSDLAEVTCTIAVTEIKIIGNDFDDSEFTRSLAESDELLPRLKIA